ncbi:MAG: gamma-glutamyl-gamma-aminobutyrate hydrolase family protein [Planctomycetes bacterium]|nr:gamma-glutamyl-gamma-aminobutyrate hydrolase family protein [Planctomycetota bacterium]
MKPRIGITSNLTVLDGRLRAHLAAAYLDAVAAAGGTPIILAPPPDPADAPAALDAVAALIPSGGADVDPQLWGEAPHPKTSILDPRRQRWDLRLIAEADARRMPVLGICLGCQEMAVARGGRLIQHVPDEPGARPHHGGDAHPRITHPVAIERGSLLARIVGAENLDVNSSHHQAAREPGRSMCVVARSPDGIIEAIEDPSPGRFFLGVQWHPEDIADQLRHRALFEALVRAAAGTRT